jgi:4-hydroxy-3-polyprenylbenzoate decarboxylase
LEITELADREMKKPGGGKALLIEKPTVSGVVSPFPLAINTLGSAHRMAMSMGAESIDAVAAELGSLMKAKPPTGIREAMKLLGTALDLRHAKPKAVKTGPCKEVIHRFDAGEKVGRGGSGRIGASPPTLLNLPIQQCWPQDGGRFITFPCVVTRDPDSGERNVGLYRMQVYDERSTECTGNCKRSPRATAGAITKRARACQCGVFWEAIRCLRFAPTALCRRLDEVLLAGYLRKQSVELVKCETNDLEVPANADVVLEGYVDPKDPFAMEGPSAIILDTTRCPSRTGVSHHRDHAPQRCDLSGARSWACRRWRIFISERERSAVPAHFQNELSERSWISRCPRKACFTTLFL